MLRAVFVVLILLGGLVESDAASRRQQPPNSPRESAVESVQSVLALARGDLETYKRYLLELLAYHEAQAAKKQFDLAPLSDSIIRYAQERSVVLTREDYDRKLGDAQKLLLQGINSGMRRFHQERMREIFMSLSLVCSLMSDAECELEYEKLAQQQE